MSRFPPRTQPTAAKTPPAKAAPPKPATRKPSSKPEPESSHVARVAFPFGNPASAAGSNRSKAFGSIPGVLVLLNRDDPKDSVAFATDGVVCVVVHCEVTVVDEAAALPAYWLVPAVALGNNALPVLVYASGEFMSTDGTVSPKGERFAPPAWSINQGLEQRVVNAMRSYASGVRKAVFASLNSENLARCVRAVSSNDLADVGCGDSYGPAFVGGNGGVAMLSSLTTNSQKYAEPSTRDERNTEVREQCYAVVRKFINLLSGCYATKPMEDPPTGAQLLLPGSPEPAKPTKRRKDAPASPPPPPPPANDEGYDID